MDHRWSCRYNVQCIRQWMDGRSKLLQLVSETIFIPSVAHLLESGPVILFIGGHGSHIGYNLVTYARKEGVVLMCLPPHTSHVLQPLDISCYGPLKQVWRQTIKKHNMSTAAAHVTKDVFPSLLMTTWQKSPLPRQLQSGFQSAGLHPLSKSAVPESKITPSLCCTENPPPNSMSPSPGVEVQCLCTHRYPHLTPVRIHLRGYFSKLLTAKSQTTAAKGQSKAKFKPSCYGQALTTDEIEELLSAREESREIRLKKKKATSHKTTMVQKARQKGTQRKSKAQSHHHYNKDTEDSSHSGGKLYADLYLEDI